MVTNKDLDLPTQQELLAQFRCDEIANGAFAAFAEAIQAFSVSPGPGKLIQGLGSLMANARSVALASFDTAASRYHSGVYSRKRQELLAKLNSGLSPLFLSHLKNLHKIVLKDFRKQIQDGLKADGYDFAKVVQETMAQAEKAFETQAKEVRLEDTEWSTEETEQQLKEDMHAVADLLRVEETRKMVTVIERNIKRQVEETVEVSLNKPSEGMWDVILSTFKAALAKAEDAYLKKANSTYLLHVEMFIVCVHFPDKHWRRFQLHCRGERDCTDAAAATRLARSPIQGRRADERVGHVGQAQTAVRGQVPLR